MASALGIDVGTTNVKVALVAGDGTTVGSAQRPLVMRRDGGTAEQDAETTWATLVDAVREITSSHPAAAAGVTAVGVCSQYSSIVPIDAQARPLLPMLMWQDTRGTDRSFEIMARDDAAFMTFVEHHGIPPVGGGLSLAHILYVQHDRPDVHARTAAYVESMDYLTARLTGRITATQHSTFMYQLCDNRRLDPPAYDDELVRLAGVDASRLPPLVGIDEPIGTLLPDVAAELGLPASATVYAGTNDTATAAVATGAFAPGRGGISIGTTSVLVDEVDTFHVDLEHQIFPMPAPFRDRYVVCAENGLGGKVLEHVLRNLVYAVDELGDHRAADPFATLDPVLHNARPGAGGLMFLPWLGGAHAPQGDEAMRGGFVNMSLETTRADMIARRGRRRRPQPALAVASGRSVHREPGGGDRARRRRGPLRRVVPGARRRPRPARSRPHFARRRHRPRHRPARAAALRSVVTRRSRPRTERRRDPLRTRAGEPRALRRSTRTVRGCLRCSSPDQ